MDKRSVLGNRGIIGAVLVLAVLIAFLPALRNGFVYDDGQYILLNPHVHAGWTHDAVSWAFTSTYAANWHPITWLSHMVDCRLFALKPAGHHLINLLLHLSNVLLLFLVLSRMTGSPWKSGFVAALFGLHPLRLESVAWIAERKDVLSTLFWLLTMWSYVRYAGFKVQGSRFKVGTAYVSVIVFFAIGLMSKPMLVTLPFVLLLLDYWPLRRFGGSPHPNPLPLRGCTGEGVTNPESRSTPVTRYSLLVTEKLPLFALALLSSVITYLAQHKGQALGLVEDYPIWVRLANAPISYAAYVGKMVWPRCLAVLYPHPGVGIPVWQGAVSGVALALITVLAIRAARRRPYIAVGWLWYLGTLVPVIGVVQVGAQAMADRYTYVPLIGLFILLAWGIPESVNGRMGERENGRPRSPIPPFLHSSILLLSALVVLTALGVSTWVQARYWKDNETLYRRALACTSRNYLILNNMGLALSDKGRVDEAMRFYRRGLSIAPEFHVLHLNLGEALAEKGRLDDAIAGYRTALKYRPDYADTHNNLGLALYEKGNVDEALKEYQEALRLDPANANAHYNLAGALARRGEFEEAADHLRQAIAGKPAFADAHYNLGNILFMLGRLDEAAEQLREVVRLDPRDAAAHYKLANVFRKAERYGDAIEHYSQAIEIKPDLVKARNNLAVALYMEGRYAEAWEQVRVLRESGAPPHPAFVAALASKMPEP